MIDPDLRCVRHDRHLQLPHERNVPPPVLIHDDNCEHFKDDEKASNKSRPVSSFTSYHSQQNKEMLELAQNEGMNEKFIE